MDDSIPTYFEATSTASPPAFTLSPPPSTTSPLPTFLSLLPTEDPPAYAVLDAHQTTFSLHGTFIHTPSGGPTYQISSPLTTRGASFRIRRLRRRESQQQERNGRAIAFDRENVLYEVNDPPLLEGEWHVIGKRRGCLPGVLMMKWRRVHGGKGGKWKVSQVLRPGAKGAELITCKPSKSSPSPSRSSPLLLAYEWKLPSKEVIATESFRIEADGSVVPILELKVGLEQRWREMLITLWVARLWVISGKEKTRSLGDRTRLVRYGDAVGAGGRGTLLGLGVLGMGGGIR